MMAKTTTLAVPVLDISEKEMWVYRIYHMYSDRQA